MTLGIQGILVLVLLNTVGQLFLKQAVVSKDKVQIICLFLGYFCFFLTIVTSYFLMKIVPLRYFTVVMSLNYISVLFASAYYFKEKLSISKLLGILIVMMGIFIFMMDFSNVY
jgi:drug/metabolite transporter (DMT)-like permease